MAFKYEFVDPEERKQRRRKLQGVLVAVTLCLALFSYQQWFEVQSRIYSLHAARRFSEIVMSVKTDAIREKIAYEVTLTSKRTFEVSKTEHCGPKATRTVVERFDLKQWSGDISFVLDKSSIKRICYDPIYGSSLSMDGLLKGVIVLGASSDLNRFAEDNAEVNFVGLNADIEFI